MFQSSRPRSPFDRSPLGGIGSLIVGILVLVLLFKLAGFVFSLLKWIAPIMFIASLIIDHKVFLGYVNGIRRLFERNWVYGLVAGLLSIVAFPVVALYLLGMALFKKKVRDVRREQDERVNGKWTDYEEVPEEPLDLDIPYEELPPEPQPRTRRDGNDYDELFK